ncbi:hypothetical protein [Pseudomonas sp. BN417]|nr:hypothetical protein [Pseudomonas sp. BN417]
MRIAFGAEKNKRKAKWRDWAHDQVNALNPPECLGAVKRALARMD